MFRSNKSDYTDVVMPFLHVAAMLLRIKTARPPPPFVLSRRNNSYPLT